MELLWIGLGVLVILLIFVITRIKIVPQSQVYVIERLGAYHADWHTGMHFLVPFVDKVARSEEHTSELQSPW